MYSEELGQSSANGLVIWYGTMDYESPLDVSIDNDDDEGFPDASTFYENGKVVDKPCDSCDPKETGIDGMPTRSDLVRKTMSTVHERVQKSLGVGKEIYFMPIDVSESYNKSLGYAIKIYGILEDGSKAAVTLKGSNHSFDVLVPDDITVEKYEQELLKLFTDTKDKPTMKKLYGFPLRGYRESPAKYLRLSGLSIKDRKIAIETLVPRITRENYDDHTADDNKVKYETAGDDKSHYYRKVSRESQKTLSDWVILKKYYRTVDPIQMEQYCPTCDHQFIVDLKDYSPLVNPMDPKHRRDVGEKIRMDSPSLSMDKTLIMTWDIEAYSSLGTGSLPLPKNKEDRIIMIAMTLHWKDDRNPLLSICLVDVPSAPDDRWITVVCGTERNILKAFALCIRMYAPDIILGFNDSCYDWPFVVERAKSYDILGWMHNTMSASPRKDVPKSGVIYKWNYPEHKIKITPEEVYSGRHLKIPGCISIDVRAHFKKLYPKNEEPVASSLKYYLEVNKLGGKADLPIVEMWRYYKEAHSKFCLDKSRDLDTSEAENMRKVAHYCVLDALRCQHLMVTRGVINDFRSVSSMAFVTLFDAHYYAVGMKVCNLLGAYANRMNIFVSMLSIRRNSDEKYPGAYVFPPDKGLVPDTERLHRLVNSANVVLSIYGADKFGDMMRHASLRNYSEKYLDEARDQFSDHMSEMREFIYAMKDFARDRPITGLDFASLYPSLIRAYNFSPERMVSTEEEADRWMMNGKSTHKVEFQYGDKMIRAWTIRHNNDAKHMGLYPIVLDDLFNKRLEVKRGLAPHSFVMEQIDSVESFMKLRRVRMIDAIGLLIENKTLEIQSFQKMLIPPVVVALGSTEADEISYINGRISSLNKSIEFLRKLLDGGDDLESRAASMYSSAKFSFIGLNVRQGALKVYMNSFYGETGNAISPFFMLALAGGVTSAGQMNIKKVAEYVKNREFHAKYGDSVTGCTPIIVRMEGSILIIRIDELASLIDGEWEDYRVNNSSPKQCMDLESKYIEVWSDGGFSRIRRFIRHSYNGIITRITTPNGLVDCTNCHSLLRANGTSVKPLDLQMGDELLHENASPFSGYVGESIAKRVCKEYGIERPVTFDYVTSLPISTNKVITTRIWELCKLAGLSIMQDHTGVESIGIVESSNIYVYDLETANHHFHVGPGNLVVHNTDSVYLACPNKYFVECDIAHLSGKATKLEWFTAMVKITMRVMNFTRDEVNGHLEKDNGTKYLTLNYEEVLYGACFTGKKKYFGIGHVDEVNFVPKHLFIKGIEIIKQGQTGLSKAIGGRIMKDCTDVNNNRSLDKIVKDVLTDAVRNSEQWEFDDFIKTAAYRPDKKNTSVLKFVERMKIRHAKEVRDANAARALGLEPSPYKFRIPEPGERFRYVITKSRAGKYCKSISDKMEYADYIRDYGRSANEGYEIDIAYYISKYVTGICARFINGQEEFLTEKILKIPEDKRDMHTQQLAKKSLTSFIKSLGTSGDEMSFKEVITKNKLREKICKYLRLRILEVHGTDISEMLHGRYINYKMFVVDENRLGTSKEIEPDDDIAIYESGARGMDEADIIELPGVIFTRLDNDDRISNAEKIVCRDNEERTWNKAIIDGICMDICAGANKFIKNSFNKDKPLGFVEFSLSDKKIMVESFRDSLKMIKIRTIEKINATIPRVMDLVIAYDVWIDRLVSVLEIDIMNTSAIDCLIEDIYGLDLSCLSDLKNLWYELIGVLHMLL